MRGWGEVGRVVVSIDKEADFGGVRSVAGRSAEDVSGEAVMSVSRRVPIECREKTSNHTHPHSSPTPDYTTCA